MRLRVKKKAEKLNLIPILDAVFIFIFFLLMSAQFVEIYEIGTDAPTMKSVEKDREKDPLNLTIDITRNHLTISKGVKRKTVKKISLNNKTKAHEELQKLLADIKSKNKDEKTVILRPRNNISYKRIVEVMDSARAIKSEKIKKTLFSQVVFEKP